VRQEEITEGKAESLVCNHCVYENDHGVTYDRERAEESSKRDIYKIYKICKKFDAIFLSLRLYC